MKTTILAALLLIALTIGSPGESRGSGEASKSDAPVPGATVGIPALAVPEAEFNFGEMNEDEEYIHHFVVMNGGTGVLEIKKVNPG